MRLGLALAAALLALPAAGLGQEPPACNGALSVEQVIAAKGLEPGKFQDYVRNCRLGFLLSDAVLEQLRTAGLPDSALDALKRLDAGSSLDQKLQAIRESALRKEIPLMLRMQRWSDAERLIAELLRLAPGDSQAVDWRQRLAAGKPGGGPAVQAKPNPAPAAAQNAAIQQALKEREQAANFLRPAPDPPATGGAAPRPVNEVEDAARKMREVKATLTRVRAKQALDARKWDQAESAIAELKAMPGNEAEAGALESSLRAAREQASREEAENRAKAERLRQLMGAATQALDASQWASAREAVAAYKAAGGAGPEVEAWEGRIRAGLEAEQRRQAESARQSPPDPEFARLRFEFVPMAPAQSAMGALEGPPDSRPARVVRITKAFEAGRYEVTQAQWTAFMGTNPSQFQGADRPVERVSWEDVQLFLAKLNARNDGYRYRLPTEAEWEMIARAGELPGEPVESFAWFDQNAGGQTRPVGGKKADKTGLFDVRGNVWEWCQDWYGSDYYSKGPAADPQGPETGTHRVVRGGSWRNGSGAASRPWTRNWYAPNVRIENVGFRCVRERVR